MKKKIFVGVSCAIIVLAVVIGIYQYYHPTHYLYNDRFIIGNTKENIIEKYGEFSWSSNGIDSDSDHVAYMIRDDTPELFMGYDNSLWYDIYFDDGIATEVCLREGWIGG